MMLNPVLTRSLPLFKITSLFEVHFTCHTIPPLKVSNSMVFCILTDICNLNHNQFKKIHHPEKKHLAVTPPSPPDLQGPRKSLMDFLCLQFCLFWTFRRNGITHYVVFRDWLLLLGKMLPRLIRVAAVVRTSFLSLAG